MIVAKLNQSEFEYDIHSLIKAFYPSENVSATVEDKEYGEPVTSRMTVDYGENCIDICWWNGDAKTPEASDIIAQAETEVDFSDRKEAKNSLKRLLYGMLSEHTGKKLPWGNLTGIRPTKIPMKLLEAGKSREEIRTFMKDTYAASDEKIDLAVDIAERELALLGKIDYENGYSLYVGIPFCPTTCLYCSFTSYPLASWEARMDAYLDALEKEIDFVAEKFRGKYLNSIYIGGGTPTTLHPAQLERLITKIKSSFDLSHCLEFTVEAGRPDSITRDKLVVLREQGISRISINPQTMKQETLKLIGRHHTVAQTIESFQMARELGFDNINMDLILGLPGEDLSDVEHTMKEIEKLSPDNLTVHSLALKRAARLNIEREAYAGYQMVNTQEHMDIAASYAKKMGLLPYYLYRQKSMAGNLENVGYALPGKAGVYNILIMEEKQTIMALGAGATTKFVRYLPKEGTGEKVFEAVRVENVKDVANYLERVDEMIERKRKKMEELSWH